MSWFMVTSADGTKMVRRRDHEADFAGGEATLLGGRGVLAARACETDLGLVRQQLGAPMGATSRQCRNDALPRRRRPLGEIGSSARDEGLGDLPVDVHGRV